jgi:hypothetical protein
MAFLTQAMNQFTQAPILGLVDLIPSPNVIGAQIVSTSTASIQNGSAVKLVDGTGALPLVDAVTGPTDGPVYGVIPYTARKNLYVANDIVQVCLTTSFMYLKSSAAIVRGAVVSTVAATTTADPTVATAVTSTDYVLGVCIDKATAANQLVRINIKPGAIGALQ